ncbi:MAG TPA: DMT family transporter [Stellaceae bacterium]|nr:DMT family transporter [Stellaceae bacterium]
MPLDVSVASTTIVPRWRALLPYMALTVTMMCWGGNWVVGRAIRGDMPPAALNFWRWTVALAILAPVALPGLRGKGRVLRRHWRLIAGLGGSGVVAFQLLAYLGLQSTTTVNAVVMNSAAPVFIILCCWAIDRDRVSPRQIAGMAISFLGIVTIMEEGKLAALADFKVRLGDVLILSAMPFWGLYAVLLKRRPRELDPPALLFSVAVAGVLMLAPLYAVETAFIRAPDATLASVEAVLYVGIFASVVGFFCWNYGASVVGPNRAGFMLHLLPGFGTLFAILFLGESLRLYHVIGIGTIIAGVLLATSARAPAR